MSPPSLALHLFTAPGETLWAPGWNPVILSGDGTGQDTVFVTSHGRQVYVWVVVDFDTQSHRVRYARVTPGSDAGTVEVSLRSNGEGGSTVTVRYELTSLSHAGNLRLAHFDGGAFREMLAEWNQHLQAAEID